MDAETITESLTEIIAPKQDILSTLAQIWYMKHVRAHGNRMQLSKFAYLRKRVSLTKKLEHHFLLLGPN